MTAMAVLDRSLFGRQSSHARGFRMPPDSGKKAEYGYVAWKYFACMGIIGMAGLMVLFLRGSTSGIVRPLLLIIGAPVAFVGLYVGASYLYLYPTVYRTRPGSNPIGETVRETGLRDPRVLDVGCGTGRVSIQVAKALKTSHVTGVDIYEGVSGNSPDIARRNAEIEGVADRVKFSYGNAMELPFDDDTFDVVTMGSVLHEMHGPEDQAKALREVVRVLRPGGRFVTLELVRNWKMYVTLLPFALVWKPVDCWRHLFERVGGRVTELRIQGGVLDSAVFAVEFESGKARGFRDCCLP